MNDRGLLGALQSCSLHALLMLTSKTLALSGFGDTEILDRRQSKQKSRHGGHELRCQTTFGLLPVKVIVKVVQDSVRLRMLDELTTAVKRTGSDFGLLVATGRIGRQALKEREFYRREGIAILDGTTLAALLRKHQIGTRGKGEVDYAFFGSLEEASLRVLSFVREVSR